MNKTRLLIAVALSVAGCGGEAVDTTGFAMGPVGFNSALFYLDGRQGAGVIVDPVGKAGPRGNRQLHRINAGQAPSGVMTAPLPDADAGREQLLVLDPKGEQVVRVRDKAGAADVLPLDVPLQAVDAAPNGRWGLAYSPEGAAPSRNLFAFPNSVAVLDLSPESPGAQTLRLGDAGARPLRAVFSDSLKLAGAGDGQGTRALAVALVFVEGGVVPVDLPSAEAGALVPLTADRTRSILPAEVLFTNNRGDTTRGNMDGVERAFVRTTGGELFVLAMTLAPNEQRLSVALENVVTPDAHVDDIALFFDGQGRSLLLAAAGAELILVDGYTGVAERFSAPVSVDTLTPYRDAQDAARALGYGRESDTPRLLRIDPLALQARRATGLQVVELSRDVQDIRIGRNSRSAVLLYDQSDELGVLDMRPGGEVLDVRFAERPSAYRLVDGGEKLLVVSRAPEDGEPYLAEIALDRELATRKLRLDRGAAAVGKLGEHYWVDHGSVLGSVTFVPQDTMQADAARRFRAVRAAHLFEQEPVEGGFQKPGGLETARAGGLQ